MVTLNRMEGIKFSVVYIEYAFVWFMNFTYWVGSDCGHIMMFQIAELLGQFEHHKEQTSKNRYSLYYIQIWILLCGHSYLQRIERKNAY